MNKTLYIAHRGESFDAPENTLASFDLAWQRGDDGIELDVHLAADGHVVVCHDEDTLRTGGRKLVIREHSLAELQRLDVGAWKGPQWAGQRLATLGDVLTATPGGKAVFVEIKPNTDAAADAVARVLEQPRFAAVDARVISFHLHVLKRAKLQSPKRKCYWTIEKPPHLGEIVQQTIDAKLDGLDLEDGPWVDANLVRTLHTAKLELYLFTVDDPNRCRELESIGVDGITSNRAAWVRNSGKPF